MTRGLAILGALLCCVSGCISKADTTASNSNLGSTSVAPDASSTGLNQVDLGADEPQAGRTTQKPAALALSDNVPKTEVISFDDLNLGLEADVRFRNFMLGDKRAEDLIDKRVNIGGYISPTDRLKGITDFILLRNLECKFGPGGKADHLVHVLMKEDAAADFTDKVVYVEGTLKLNPFHSSDGSATWSIYDLHGVSVSTTPPQRLR